MLEKNRRFLKMKNDYLSKDENFPNEIIIRLESFKPFDFEHYTNVNVEIKIDGKFQPMYFRLKPTFSKSSVLWELWTHNVKTKNFKKGKIICLHTWKKGGRFWKLSDI